LQPGGHVVLATFAPDGPPKCSGLPVVRYDEAAIAAELGPAFVLRDSRRETHHTPWQTEQRFIYFRFQHVLLIDSREDQARLFHIHGQAEF
jgi:hypothetical protein